MSMDKWLINSFQSGNYKMDMDNGMCYPAPESSRNESNEYNSKKTGGGKRVKRKHKHAAKHVH